MDWEIAGDNPSPDEELTTQEFYEQLQGQLPIYQRCSALQLCLREIEGMPYEEIEITGVSWEL